MIKTVLDVGNCSVDHSDLAEMIGRHFDVEVLRALTLEDVLKTLRKTAVDLVLVNRRLHSDTRDGLEVIRRIKADPGLARIPVMLVSNYPEYQRQAQEIGAELGFGKSELDWPQTRERLRRFLCT
jgi:CheY-like chemotaxis protein